MTSATPKPRAGEHTEGPWRVSGTGFVVACDEVIGNDISLANARRIVACVNACEGIVGELPNMLELLDTTERLITERDLLRERERELVEALTELAGDIEGVYDYCKRKYLMVVSIGQFRRLNAARTILAKHGR